MARADGSVVIQVNTDSSQAQKELEDLKKEINGLSADLTKKNREIEKAVKDRDKLYETARKKQEAYNKSQDATQSAIDAQAPLVKQIEEIKAQILETQKAKDSANQNWMNGIMGADKDASAASEKLSKLNSQYQELTSEATKYDEAIKRASDAESAMRAELESANAAANSAEHHAQALSKEADMLRQNIEQAKENAGGMEKALISSEESANGLAEAGKKADDRMKKFANRIEGLARRVFIFTLISSALRNLRTYLWNAIKTNDEAVKAVARLKGAFLTLAQPLINVIIPAFTTLVNILTSVVSAISSFISALFGTTVDQSAQAAENLYNEQNALDGVGASAKKAGKSLASFDEINKLSGNANTGSGGQTNIAPDFSQQEPSNLQKILNIVEAIGAALAAWRIGKAFGLNLKEILGLAVAIYSMVKFVGSALNAWNNGVDWSNFLQMLTSAAGIVGGLYIAFGKTGAAIGLVVTGIGELIVGFHDMIENGMNWANTLTVIAGLISAGLGISLLTGSLIPALIAGFAAALTALVMWAGQSEQFVEGLKQIFQGFADFFTALVNGDLTAAGEALKLIWSGIKDVAAATWEAIKIGASTVGKWIVDKLSVMTFKFLQWCDSIGEARRNFVQNTKAAFVNLWNDIKSWWSNTVLGGIAKAKQTIQNWGTGIIDKLKDVLGIHSPSTETAQMGDYLMQGMANGITESQGLVLQVFQTLLDSLDVSFNTWQTNFLLGFSQFRTTFSELWTNFWSLMGRTFTIKWNNILTTLQQGVNNAIDALNELVDAANSLAELTGTFYHHVGHINVPTIPLPKLATGAVIPPNREFLAVLGDQKQGTNIETPLTTMVQAFRQALSEGGYGGQSEAVLMLDDEALGRIVYRLNKSESNRIGVNLAEV